MRRAATNAIRLAWIAPLILLAILWTACDRSRGVYLIPIGKFASVPLDELAKHYRDRFGIDVISLPTLSVEKATYDQARDQLVAEELISQIRRRYPKEAQGPSAVLIGLTDGDMYIRSKDWQFAFSYRESGRFGVISAARMDPLRFEERADPELLRSRVRKMLTKSIGIMYFNRKPTDDPRSVLYANVLGLDELDAMGEDF